MKALVDFGTTTELGLPDFVRVMALPLEVSGMTYGTVLEVSEMTALDRHSGLSRQLIHPTNHKDMNHAHLRTCSTEELEHGRAHETGPAMFTMISLLAMYPKGVT
jgi:hypothetical protein